MLTVVTGKVAVREVVIRGTDKELEALAEVIDAELMWDKVEAEYELIPEGFFSTLCDQLSGVED